MIEENLTKAMEERFLNGDGRQIPKGMLSILNNSTYGLKKPEFKTPEETIQHDMRTMYPNMALEYAKAWQKIKKEGK